MKKEIILREGPSTCWVIRGAFDEVSLAHWTESIPWQQNSIRIYGKTHPEPRLTAWMGTGLSVFEHTVAPLPPSQMRCASL
jgi:hypothetical protein